MPTDRTPTPPVQSPAGGTAGRPRNQQASSSEELKRLRDEVERQKKANNLQDQLNKERFRRSWISFRLSAGRLLLFVGLALLFIGAYAALIYAKQILLHDLVMHGKEIKPLAEHESIDWGQVPWWIIDWGTNFLFALASAISAGRHLYKLYELQNDE